ncbi:MAG: histidine kinase, partial [Cyclobacteriaceae bacterium]
YECREEYVSLTKELEQLEKYIRLSELQIEERGEVIFTGPEQVGELKIAPLILMVFVENAFKHSQASQSEGISIKVDIALNDGDQLVFVCENTYRSETNNEQIPKGIGLINVMKRLELLYPADYTLEIDDRNGKYHVRLLLNLTT